MEDKCVNLECTDDPIYKSDYNVPALPNPSGGGGGGGGGDYSADIAALKRDVSSLQGSISGLSHDIENLTDLTPTVLSSYTGTPEPTNVYSSSYVNSRLNSKEIYLGENAGATSNLQSGGIFIGTGAKGWGGYGITIGNYADSFGDNNITIGGIAKNGGDGKSVGSSIVIGGSALTANSMDCVIGYSAKTTGGGNAANRMALGTYSVSSRNGEVSIGDPNHNSELYQHRYIANVKAGELPEDAVNLKQMQDYVAEHSGGGGSVELLDTYTTEDIDGKAYDAAYVNSRLNTSKVLIGNNATINPMYAPEAAVVIGNDVKTAGGVSIGKDITSTAGIAIGNIITAVHGVAIGTNVTMETGPGVSMVAIGDYTRTGKNAGQSVAIGLGAGVHSTNTVAIGNAAKAIENTNYSVALGSGAQTSRQYEVSIGSGNSTSEDRTRYLANVTAGELDTDAVNKKQMEDYVAEHGGGGSGSSVELLSKYTESPTEGQAYDAAYVNSRLNNGGTIHSLYLGYNASAGPQNVALGASAKASGSNGRSVALGMWSSTSHQYSVALGGSSTTSRDFEVSIGDAETDYNYSTRYLANVKDGELDQDAVTVHQLNEAVGSINTLLETLISGEGAK